MGIFPNLGMKITKIFETTTDHPTGFFRSWHFWWFRSVPFQALSDHHLGDQRGNLEEAGDGKFH